MIVIIITSRKTNEMFKSERRILVPAHHIGRRRTTCADQTRQLKEFRVIPRFRFARIFKIFRELAHQEGFLNPSKGQTMNFVKYIKAFEILIHTGFELPHAKCGL